ncbi:hypothetical protein [Micromonospora sp. LOL_021]|uniref:hypothetical protein n=1 Tax=Micromonospora sp. LOL_021 TaxID=3345417 RepID=UPI003A89F710
MNGQFDPITLDARYQLSLDAGGEQMRIDMILLDSDAYLQMSDLELPGLPPGTWLHVDESKIQPGSPFDVLSEDDPAGAEGFVNGVTTAEWTGDGTVAGELDMRKSPTIDEQTLEILGDGPALAPFTAVIDGEGRLVELVVDADRALPGLGEITSRYSNFGEPVNLTAPPADEVVPLPDELLGLLEA